MQRYFCATHWVQGLFKCARKTRDRHGFFKDGSTQITSFFLNIITKLVHVSWQKKLDFVRVSGVTCAQLSSTGFIDSVIQITVRKIVVRWDNIRKILGEGQSLSHRPRSFWSATEETLGSGDDNGRGWAQKVCTAEENNFKD